MYQLKVIDCAKDGVTGHITAHMRIIETGDGSSCEGALETYGIDPLALESRFNSSIENWLKWVGGKMKEHHCRRTVAHEEIFTFKGKSIPIP